MSFGYTSIVPIVSALLIAHAGLCQNPDSSRLPFRIADVKRIPDSDLVNKKEGFYVTGTPDVSSDPINGFSYGIEGALFFNGKKGDSFFAYTPYRAKIEFIAVNSTKETRDFVLSADIPYIFDTRWRLRVTASYEQNPNLLYFGITESSLKGLTYYPNSDSAKVPVQDASFRDYQVNGLVGANEFYNSYFKKEAVFNVSMERIILQGKMRVLFGYEAAYINMTTFPGNSLLGNENASGQVQGLGKSSVGILQCGIIYDTRDLEPDPGKGVFVEVTNELSLKALGSGFTFNKTFLNAKAYHRLLPSVFKKLVFAGRFGLGYAASDAPFFEYADQWSSEGTIEGLGGPNTLRGYKQSRFLSRLMNFTNFELRWRFAETNFVNQHLAFSAVPFYDLGGVWDNSVDVKNLRYSSGLGLRVAWNINTILRLDYAVSREDKQVFFSLAHAF